MVLFGGVLVIGGACGFGYEARHTMTRFEEAKAAFERKDWDTVSDHLTVSQSLSSPKPKALSAFCRKYLDPILLKGAYRTTFVETSSSMVPIKDATVSFVRTEPGNRPLVSLRYIDEAVWFEVPFSNKRMGIFKGKKISMPFWPLLVRISRESYPHFEREEGYKAVLAFIRAEDETLLAMGITPSTVNSREKNWKSFASGYEARIRKFLASRRT